MSYSCLLSKENSCTNKTVQWLKENIIGLIGSIAIVLITIGIIIGLNILSKSGPPPTKFSIVEASITQFNLTNNNTLYYNFKVTISAKNFFNNTAYYKDNLNVIFSYKGNTLAWVVLEPFAIGRKNIVTLQPIVLEGHKLMNLEPQQLVEYNTETQLGSYQINLDLFTKVYCPNLRIPLISNGKQAPTFNVTACSTWDYSGVYYD